SLWYRQSEGIIYAKKQISKDYREISHINELSGFVTYCSINQEVLSDLPFYYKQLFQSKQQFHNEFWVNRENEIEQARSAVLNYNKGNKSSILITGDPLSGKTFLSHYIATNLIDQADVFTLIPPTEGTTDRRILTASIAALFNSNDHPDIIFQQISRKTVIIIDDLELWWEKSALGFEAIDYLINLIIKYSHNCLFIVNINTCSYQLIHKVKRIGQYFSSFIKLNPFTAKQLKDTILIRHNSSGFTFTLNNKKQDVFFPWDYARLFNRYFNYTKGNVGFALQTWINHINALGDNEIIISNPRIPELSIINELNKEWLFYLSLIVLHRRISYSKLKRITHGNEKETQNKIFTLLQCGLIIEKRPGIFEINPNIVVFLVNILKEKELI
ncbi:hypothetical protein ACFL6I_28560, partial [candidate division KSB1 bacterium]